MGEKPRQGYHCRRTYVPAFRVRPDTSASNDKVLPTQERVGFALILK